MGDEDWVARAAEETEFGVVAQPNERTVDPPKAQEHVEERNGVRTKVLSNGKVTVHDRPRRVFRRGARTFENVELRDCYLDIAFFAKHPSRATVVRNVRVLRGELWSPLSVEGSVLDSVEVSHLAWGGNEFIRGARFRHVKFTGEFGSLSILREPLDYPVGWAGPRELWHEAGNEFYREVDWALDIRSARFHEFDLRPGAIPTKLVLRDPATSAVVRRAKAEMADLGAIDFTGVAYHIALEFLLESDADDVLLVASSGPDRKRELEVLEQLRVAGIAEPR
jgi:hypothetical protein